MPKKIFQCLTKPIKFDILNTIEASIICSRMKSNALKNELELGIRPKQDIENKIEIINNFIKRSELLKTKVLKIDICE